jgi:hypothetical protein
MTYFNRENRTHNKAPLPLPNKTEKTHITCPLPKEKNLRPQVQIASPHWLKRI